jgi:hypothetical protein
MYTFETVRLTNSRFFMCKGFADHYLSKYRGDYFIEPDIFIPFDLIVVIPCYDEPEVGNTLQSLFECDCVGISVAIVVVINSTVNSPARVIDQNRKTVEELAPLTDQLIHGKHLFVLHVDKLPAKHGGVGWARKIGMDWAIAQFNHFNRSDGIIVSLDADTLVEDNYFHAINSGFYNDNELIAVTIYFEHSYYSSEESCNNGIGKAIVLYELYMRYYRNALLEVGFPAAIYTVGSCFVVKSRAYVAQGGMNRRKAGEDFYFLHKLSKLGKIGEINTTTVYPSSRISDRVPFGTGPIIKKYCEGDHSLELVYSLNAFLILKPFFSNTNDYYIAGKELVNEDLTTDKAFLSFLKENDIANQICSLAANCASYSVFEKRFFHLFNAFTALKWLNFSSMNSYPKEDLMMVCTKLLLLKGIEKDKIPADQEQMLLFFRQMDKEGNTIWSDKSNLKKEII